MSETAQTPKAFLTPGPYLQVHDFLGAADNAWLLDDTLARKADFKQSRVVKEDGTVVDPKVRISSNMTASDMVRGMVDKAMGRNQPRINEALAQGEFTPTKLEMEIAAHNHGAFFTTHVDTMIHGETKTKYKRVISGVYYFFRDPKGFTGGTFRMHSIMGHGAEGTYVDIEPQNDMLLVFPSWLPHEVLPVDCPSGAFADSRFAINCWSLA